jgi:hypothetical protein
LAGSRSEVVRHVCKEVEELCFTWNEAHIRAGKSPVGRAGQVLRPDL